MSEPDFHFTFHFSNFQYPLSQGTGSFGEMSDLGEFGEVGELRD